MKNKFLICAYFLLTLSISSLVIVESIFAVDESNNNKLSRSSYEQMMIQAFEFVKENYVEPVNDEVIFEGALKGIFQALGDPYSQYLTKKDLEEISKTTVGDYVGIGISIIKKMHSQDKQDKAKNLDSNSFCVSIVTPFEGGPAYKAGIKSGDCIIAVDGKSVSSMEVDQVVDRLKGKEGTKVKVSILRGKDLTLDFELTREKIEIQTIKYDVINPDIGYIRIVSFNPYTSVDFSKALDNLKNRNIKSLILDLRLNTGGYFQAAIKMADDILSKGTIVSTKSRNSSKPIDYKASSKQVLPSDIKIVALIDRSSASASEVFVGALKDNKRAYIIGEKSYGKGVIQHVVPFYTGGFKITSSKYYTPSGKSIHKVGIEPDLEIKSPDFSEEEAVIYKEIFDKKLIEGFLKGKKSITEQEIDFFVENLVKENPKYKIDKEFLGKYVFFNYYQDNNKELPIYNLHYDKVLKAACEYLSKLGN
ncbi:MULTISPECIES: S41 family peptidase [Borreliella]|uniref:Carboxyl-terminal protease n=1 Tax=Borrelia garinii subsp. bavariensis (strain ATCC BAA-2496 / DSM 23469 / PBi) TaxID=290434 RepID=A0A7I6GW39_BORGP|nr:MULTISPECIES: S41 family peptidase [Borreliella]AAU07212.1 carboxyl-terminal protease [Borreliella bavariensis PBi]AZA26772.1 PDZ domain-containing protein [Borreliella bavariensis PBi]WLN24022.1 S41 family peptidase [Borreliella bavariensis]